MSLDRTRGRNLGGAALFAVLGCFELYYARRAQINHTVIFHKASWYAPQVGYFIAFCFFAMAVVLLVAGLIRPMHAGVKLALKIVGAILLAVMLLLGIAVAYQRWQFHLPSDAKAKAVFGARKKELESLVLTVSRDAEIDFVSADWVAYGSAARDPAHIACAKVLKKIGAKFLRQGRGVVEVYFWGSGCAICHDSCKGFAYVRDLSFDMPPDWKICSSLDNRSLPPGRYAPVEDGSYLLPLSEHWNIIRLEQG
jgi:hypothetical protein